MKVPKSQRIRYRPHPFVAAVAAAGLHANTAGFQVEIVMYYNELRRIHSRLGDDRRNGFSTEVHIGQGLDQSQVRVEYFEATRLCFICRFRPSYSRGLCNSIYDHEAQVVPMPGVLWTGIAETDDDESAQSHET